MVHSMSQKLRLLGFSLASCFSLSWGIAVRSQPVPSVSVEVSTLERLQQSDRGILLQIEGDLPPYAIVSNPVTQSIEFRLRSTQVSPQFLDSTSNIDLSEAGIQRVETVPLEAGEAIAVIFYLEPDSELATWQVRARPDGLLLVSPQAVAVEPTDPEVELETPAPSSEVVPPIQNQEVDPANEPIAQTPASTILTPLQTIHPRFPTAQHLERGEVIAQIHNRLYFFDSVEDEGTGAYPTLGFTWGITDSIQLTLDYQRVDTGGPGEQGDFIAIRNPRDDEPFLDAQEITLEIKQRFWQNESETQAISGVVSASVGDRGFRFTDEDGEVTEGVRDGIVPAIQVPYTASLSEGRLHLTFAPTVAFFDEENALHLHQPPTGDPEDFGTTFGLAGAISYRIDPRIVLWGDLFVPLSGNNSIDRDDGEPVQTPAYNAGLRYLVNPSLAVDVFASNTLGRTGPLSLTSDRELVAFGAGVSFLPSFIAANRRYSDTFGDPTLPTPITDDGFAFYDGGVLDRGQFLANIQAGSQGLLTSLRYAPVRDLELGIYLDSVSGEVDESEQGIAGKVRILDQALGAPFTASVAATFGITNEPFVNFFNNDRNEFDERDLDEGTPFFLQVDDIDEGRLIIATLSFPLHYRFDNGIAAWVTPIFGFVQRDGVEIGGVNVGGSFPITDNLNLIGEVGANFAGEGNGFVDEDEDELEDALAYTIGLRWQFAQLLGLNPEAIEEPLQLELYLTNRVGSSTFHSLRVREDNDLAIGVGLFVPFRF